MAATTTRRGWSPRRCRGTKPLKPDMRTHVHRWIHRNNPGNDHRRWPNHSRSDFDPRCPPLLADPQHVSSELTTRRDHSKPTITKVTEPLKFDGGSEPGKGSKHADSEEVPAGACAFLERIEPRPRFRCRAAWLPLCRPRRTGTPHGADLVVSIARSASESPAGARPSASGRSRLESAGTDPGRRRSRR